MGYLDKTTQTVTATFTKRGREILANALSGTAEDEKSYIITQFSLSDDEVDYGLWEDNPDSDGNIAQGDVISNQPLTEPTFNNSEMMKYLLYKNKEM